MVIRHIKNIYKNSSFKLFSADLIDVNIGQYLINHVFKVCQNHIYHPKSLLQNLILCQNLTITALNY